MFDKTKELNWTGNSIDSNLRQFILAVLNYNFKKNISMKKKNKSEKREVEKNDRKK